MQIHLRINGFTWDEWPNQEPTSFNDFSVGEEQSTSNVIAISWSPLGLARNKRSVLAVLTSNLVLSFWASNSDPSMHASWERVFVVNSGVGKSWKSNSRLSHTSHPAPSVPRRLRRIRSVAWAPLIQRRLECGDSRFGSASNIYFLAVTTDDRSVLFLSVSSPYTDGSTGWDAGIVEQYIFREDNSMSKSVLTAEAVEEPPDSQAIGCREQSVSEQEYLYGRGSLFHTALKTKYFIDRVSWGAWIETKALTEIAVKFEINHASVGHAIFYVSHDFPLRTSLSKLSGSLQTSMLTYYYEDLDMDSLGLPHSTLRKQALQLRAKYDRQNDYGGLTIIKSWGLATYKGYAAMCVTFHPGDMVDYLLASEERATILFSIGETSHLDTELDTFSWERERKPADITATQRLILKMIFDFEKQSRLDSAGLSDRIIYAAACASMLLWDVERAERLSLAKSVLERLGQRTNVDVSSEINACSHLLRSPNIDMEEAAAVVGGAIGSRNKEDLETSTKVFDVCSICAHAIPWQSLLEATCTQGHLFG